MTLIPKLALAQFTTRRARTALTLSAIALSVSLIVSVTSGYASVEHAIQRYFAMYMGSFDAQVTRANDQRGSVPEKVVGLLNQDTRVRRAVGRLETESSLIGHDGKPVDGHAAMIVGIDPAVDVRVQNLKMHAGKWFTAGDGDVAVIDQIATEVLHADVGQTFQMPGTPKPLELTVDGIIHKPTILASGVQTVYVPLRTLQKYLSPENPDVVTRITIQLKNGVDPNAFATDWRPKLNAIDPLLQLKLTAENKKQLDIMLSGIRILSYLGSAISMLAATFIIFSALAMGVMERQRTLAMLRAIGAGKGQLGRLVVTEGLILAVVGIGIGCPLGFFWISLLGHHFRDIFPTGVVWDPWGVLFASSCSLLAALGASLIPAWSAMRLSPLEAMTPLAREQNRRPPLITAAIGILCIGIDPFLLYEIPGKLFHLSAAMSGSVAFFGHFVAGAPGLMLGFFLLAPLFVWVVERTAGPLLALVMGVKPLLLRQQLSGGGLWRSAGTCTALMVGLSILVVMQTQGNSMLSSWKLPDKFPDVFIGVFSFGGMPADQIAKAAAVSGIKQVNGKGELMPIAIASPGLGGGAMGIAAAALMPDATMFFGVDPDLGFKLMELDFREGNARSAEKLLKKGRHVVITLEFQRLKNLHIGGKLQLLTSRHGMVDYTVAGVVWSPGIDVIVSSYDMGRQFDQRTAASVFGTLADAKEDFGVDSYHLLAANTDLHVDKDKLLDRMKEATGVYGMKIGDVRQIKHDIELGLRRLLLLMSTVAFAAMAVASLGVANTVMASIRSRTWQFGILRSIGLTRGGLLRLVVAESILIGLIGAVLGLCAGAMMTFNARQLSAISIGVVPPVAVPWEIIGVGTGLIMVLSIVASLWPAIVTARDETLSLLQTGRAAA